MSEERAYAVSIEVNGTINYSDQDLIDVILCASEMYDQGGMMGKRPVSIIEEGRVYHEGIIRFTKKFPNTVFCIKAYSQDQDMERYYYKDGKYQECFPSIIFPKYEESKLKR